MYIKVGLTLLIRTTIHAFLWGWVLFSLFEHFGEQAGVFQPSYWLCCATVWTLMFFVEFFQGIRRQLAEDGELQTIPFGELIRELSVSMMVALIAIFGHHIFSVLP